MYNRKNTKRALGMSFLSMLLCFSMLIGSTMAWFTDTASTKVNKIESGTLNIDIQDKNNQTLEGQTLQFVQNGNLVEADAFKWEPGATFELEAATVVNLGNLYAKCKVVLTGVNGNANNSTYKLSDVIDVTIDGQPAGTLSQLLANGGVLGNEFTLAPKGQEGSSATYGTIKLHMQETADNNYQELYIDGLSVTVYATQATAEFDSTTDQYDKEAKIEIVENQEQLNDVIANTNGPVNVVLPATPKDEPIKLPSLSNKDVTFVGTKDTVIDLTEAVTASGSTVTMEGITVNVDGKGTYQGIQHAEKVVYKNVTFNGTQFLYSDAEFTNCTFNVSGDKYNIWVYGNDATFTNCTFNCDGKAVLQYNEGTLTAEVIFNNCTFNDNGDNTVTNKAAVEIAESTHSGAQATYTIKLNNCTVNGFAVTEDKTSDLNSGGNNLGTNVWGNKNQMPADRLNVVINGEEVY